MSITNSGIGIGIGIGLVIGTIIGLTQLMQTSL